MTFTTLLFEIDDAGIALATVNRPEKLNALNQDVISDLAALASRVSGDSSVKALIITGAGEKAFVAGADIGELSSTDATSGTDLAETGQAAFRALERLKIPVIAAVNGFALGGGCELAMACHLRMAAPNAKFGQPEVKLGLIPGYGGTVRLPRLVGRGRALDILLSGRMVGAEEAEQIGLVDRLTVEGEDLLRAARALASGILKMGPLAIGLCLESVDQGLDLPLDDALALEARNFGKACGSSDKNEGTSAFLEKREAVFHGH